MNTQQDRDRQADDSPSSNETDVTRSQNQQASAAASGSSQDREGSLSEDGGPHQAEGPDHTGGHSEGQYNKEDNGQTMGEVGKAGEESRK